MYHCVDDDRVLRARFPRVYRLPSVVFVVRAEGGVETTAAEISPTVHHFNIYVYTQHVGEYSYVLVAVLLRFA